MIQTARITSEFDAELQLGGRWFFTALTLLNEQNILLPNGPPPPFQPDATVTITDVQVIKQDGFDLQIDVTIGILPLQILASLSLSADGETLVIDTNIPDVSMSIPFDAFEGLAHPPALVNLPGDATHEPVIALLANLNIQSGAQSEEPLPNGEFQERGDPALAQSFLPNGQHVAIGIGKESFSRFANHIWHTSLRANDGSHPLPNKKEKQGDWSKVTMVSESNRLRIIMEGDIPVDSPIIDLIPDPHVTITVSITPHISNGQLQFEMDSSTDIDTGLLGDLFAFLAGGFVGFIIGIFTGGILLAAGIGAVAGVILLEITEVIVEGIVQKKINAMLNGKPLPDVTCCHNEVVKIASPKSASSLNLSMLNAIPSSIPLHTHNPDALYERTLLITSFFEDMTVDSNGWGIAGTSTTGEKFQALRATLVDSTYEQDELTTLSYRALDGTVIELPLSEVLSRMQHSELKPPVTLQEAPDKVTYRIPEGKLASVCLRPSAIRREDTVIKELEFSGGLVLKVQDAITLQDAAALVVNGYQLIHPKTYNAYYRAKADDATHNNLENLPRF